MVLFADRSGKSDWSTGNRIDEGELAATGLRSGHGTESPTRKTRTDVQTERRIQWHQLILNVSSGRPIGGGTPWSEMLFEKSGGEDDDAFKEAWNHMSNYDFSGIFAFSPSLLFS